MKLVNYPKRLVIHGINSLTIVSIPKMQELHTFFNGANSRAFELINLRGECVKRVVVDTRKEKYFVKF